MIASARFRKPTVSFSVFVLLMFLKMGFCTRFVPKQTRKKIGSFGDRLTQL